MTHLGLHSDEKKMEAQKLIKIKIREAYIDIVLILFIAAAFSWFTIIPMAVWLYWVIYFIFFSAGQIKSLLEILSSRVYLFGIDWKAVKKSEETEVKKKKSDKVLHIIMNCLFFYWCIVNVFFEPNIHPAGWFMRSTAGLFAVIGWWNLFKNVREIRTLKKELRR